jgi:hypothetical protein
MNKTYFVLISGLLILMLQFMFLNSFSQSQATDFEGLKGIRIAHSISDKTDSLSSQVIIELRDAEGIPVWFYRDIFKTVCLTKECRMVRLRIYWNGAGNYAGMQIPKNEPLTKTDHSEFNPEDYQKLNRILSDSLSVLKGLKLKDLIVEKEDKNNSQVDAISGATQPFIYESVVRNAVYTCYTLWHTVYGTTREKISSMLNTRADSAYLKRIFARDDPQYLIWAIDFLGKHPEYHSAFNQVVINTIKSKNVDLAQKALHYYTPTWLTDVDIQKELASVMGEVSSQSKFELIWMLAAVPQISNDVILVLLEQYENKIINAGLLGYVFKLIRKENLSDVRIIKKIKSLSKDKNLYVSNMAQKLISEKSN